MQSAGAVAALLKKVPPEDDSSWKLVAVASLSRLVTLTAGVADLIGAANVGSTRPLIRALFETTCGLLYLLKDPNERDARGLAYRRFKLESGRKLLNQILRDQSELATLDVDVDRQAIQAELMSIEECLADERFRSQTDSAKDWRRFRYWHQAEGGPDNVPSLASEVGLRPFYFWYKRLSGTIHGSDVLSEFRTDGAEHFLVSRDPTGSQTVTIMAQALLMQSAREFAIILGRRYQDEFDYRMIAHVNYWRLRARRMDVGFKVDR